MNRGWRSLPASMAALAAALAVAACGGGGGGTTPAPICSVSGVTVSASPAAVAANLPATLTATVNASAGCATGVSWSAAPAGATLAPSGLTATLTSATPGSYTVTAASHADPSRVGSASVDVTAAAVCGQPNGTEVTHTVDILASETWAGDGVTHRVPAGIAVRGSAVVTVMPCAIVALGRDASITLRDSARLVAAGTGSARFVLFKRANAAEAWGLLRGFHSTALIDLQWTTLSGGGSLGGGLANASIAVAGDGYTAPLARVLRLDNVGIEQSQGVGILLDANAAFSTDSQAVSISGAGGEPVRSTIAALDSLPTGSYGGNARDEIVVHGPSFNISSDMTIHDRGVPVRLATSSMRIQPVLPQTLPVTLTIEPGVVLKFARINASTAGAQVIFGSNGASPNNAVGVLRAIGTAAKPIVFTSGEAVPAPGDWIGLWLNTANGSRLEHVEISYAGAPNGIQSNNCRPLGTEDQAALIVGDFEEQFVPPADLISNSRIRASAGFGINAIWRTTAFNSPDLTATNVFENNAWCRQTYNAVSSPGSCPLQRGCTVN